MTLRFNFLGEPTILLPDNEKVGLGRKNIGLLAYLTVSPDLSSSRSVLASLLWSDRGEEQARDSLRQSISAIRRAFQNVEPEPFSSTRTSVMLNASVVVSDVLEMNDLSRSGTVQAWEGIANLYAGKFLEGIDVRGKAFEDWCEERRIQFEKLAIVSLENLLEHHKEHPEDERRYHWAVHLGKIDGFNEAAARAKIDYFGASGETAKAAIEFENIKLTLANELGVEPSQSTLSSYQRAVSSDTRQSVQVKAPEPGHAADGLSQSAARQSAAKAQDGFHGFPRIAVLPLRNLSGDSDQIYFADGVTEDIIVSLSSFRALRVVSSQSSFSFRQAQHDPLDVAEALHAGYLVSGSLRRSNDRIRINVELVSGTSGENVWASRFDGTISEIFEIQDSISSSIANCVVGQVERKAVDFSRRVPTSHLSAYDYYLRGNEKLHQVRWHENVQARELFGEALSIDSQFPRAHAAMALAVFDSVFMGWDDSGLVDHGIEHASKASQLDPVDSHAQLALGMLNFLQRDFDSAEFHLNAAYRLNENDTDIMIYFAIVMIYAGRPDEAISWVERASRLNPLHPDFYYTVHGVALFWMRSYAEAIASFKRRSGHDRMVLAYWAAAEDSHGNHQAARSIIKTLMDQDTQKHFGDKSIGDALEHEVRLYNRKEDARFIRERFHALSLL